MRVVVTGPESSGTRMACRMLSEAGAEVLHRPYPMGGQRLDGQRIAGTEVWPNISQEEWDVAVVIVRHPGAVGCSQVECGHVTAAESAQERIRKAYLDIFLHLSLASRPFYVVPYGTFAQAQKLGELLECLELAEPAITTWQDADAKYYGGPEWSDRRPLTMG